ncbi:MAG: ribulose-phosphate 3-epimerase [Gemmatimonadota bacterium]|nr:ribulose-phosphate 3-epimerase [Candidatus Palauibacterales bacterium]
MAKIAPSILSADFTRLGECIAEAEAGGADWIHVDVMDGHFVPNITIGPLVVEAARRASQLPLDVHLMIENPDLYLADFVSAGADRLTVHQEVCPHLHSTVQRIRELGARPGVAVNPATPVETLSEILQFIDLALVMTVNPGFGGQRFIPELLHKVARLVSEAQARGLAALEIEVDGGIDIDTAPAAASAGATVLVAGSAVFGSGSIQENVGNLRRSLAVDV